MKTDFIKLILRRTLLVTTPPRAALTTQERRSIQMTEPMAVLQIGDDLERN
jgi:hypothetical protein